MEQSEQAVVVASWIARHDGPPDQVAVARILAAGLDALWGEASR